MPGFTIHALEVVESCPFHGQTVPLDILESGCPANRSFHSLSPAPHPIHNPLQNAHVLAEPRPQVSAIPVFPEPVDMEDARGGGELTLHAQPMPEVVAHVIAAEGQHGHRVAAYLAARSSCRSRSL